MGTHEKTRRGFMTLYRSITGSSKPNHALRSEVPVVPAEYISTAQVYGPVMKLKRSFDGRGGLEKTGEEHCWMVKGRKSVSCVETMDLETVASFLQVKVMVCDMPGFMQVHAFRCARRSYDSLEKFSSKYMALTIKKVLLQFQSQLDLSCFISFMGQDLYSFFSITNVDIVK